MLEREITALVERVAKLPKAPVTNSPTQPVKIKGFPSGMFYGFLTEKSFLREADLKTKQYFSGTEELYYPAKQMVTILDENADWLLVAGTAKYKKDGIEHDYVTSTNKDTGQKGWIKASWIKMSPGGSTANTAGKIVNISGKVNAKLGIKLHTAPNTAAKQIQTKGYPQNSDVTIIEISGSKEPNWYRIRANDGKEGWIESRYIVQLGNKDFDPVIKESYFVEKGDMLEPLVKKRYPKYNIQTGDDFRTIVHAFSILNDGNPAIYYEGGSDSWWRDNVFDRDMAVPRGIYASIKLRQGGLIHFPTESYINYLKDTGKVGQRAGWKNHVIDAKNFGKLILNFMDGFYESIRKIVSDAWDNIQSIFTLSFFKDIYDLIKEILDNPALLIDIVKEMFSGVSDLINDLSSTDKSKKYKAYGALTGMISGKMIVTILIPGSLIPQAIVSAKKLYMFRRIEKEIEKLKQKGKSFLSARRRLIKYKNLEKGWIATWGQADANKIIDVINRRPNLRAALGLPTEPKPKVPRPKGEPNLKPQAHHIIPVDVLKNNPIIQKAVIDGFDFNGKINGIPIATDFHLKGHDLIQELINDEINEWARLNPNASGTKIKQFLEGIPNVKKGVIERWRDNWEHSESRGFILDANLTRRPFSKLRSNVEDDNDF